MLVPYLDLELDLHNTRALDSSVEELAPYLDVELDLHNTRGPLVLTLVWRMLVPYLDVELDLPNTRGNSPGVDNVSPIP